ncbi:MAG: LuxR C-terminal-related transcriptional regulator [Pseudomonadota bacterium]
MQHTEALIARILGDSRRVTLIAAPAGFGKSVLARHLAARLDAEPVRDRPGAYDATGWRLRDCPVDATDLENTDRLVIFCRPDQTPERLARARLYGDVAEIPASELLCPQSELTAAQWAVSAGWPVLAGGVVPRAEVLTAYLREDVLSDLSSEVLIAAIAGDMTSLVDRIPPLKAPDDRLSGCLETAIEQVLTDRALTGGAGALDMLEAHPGLALRLIRRALDAGAPGVALQLLTQAGGWFFFYAVPPDVFGTVIRAMPADLEDPSGTLILSRTLLALKAGETALALRLFTDGYGHRALDLTHGLTPDGPVPLHVQVFRLVILIYEDLPVTEDLVQRILALLSRLPLEAHVLRGSCYNALLELFLRQRRYPEAEDVALRAAESYERGNAALLRFYIAVHGTVMRLLRGQSGAAQPELDEARIWLGRVPFDSPSDARILRLIEAAIQFEAGQPAQMLTFLSRDLDDFSGGETWPTLAELAVQYGAQVLAEQVSTRAALDYLDRWWVRLAMNRQFRVLLDLRKAQILQSANRWGDAARALAPIPSGIDRVWIESADTAFARLATRDEIMLALCWLRQIAYEHPRLPYLGRKMGYMAANTRLTGRQRVALDIWRAHVARQTRDVLQMRALLRGVFDTAVRDNGLSVLSEEYVFLADLWRDASTSAYLSAIGPARAVMRRLEESRLPTGAEAARAHLTRQEFKVLRLLTDGASNKIIARQLGIAEPTVKFHLKNLYGKLGCARRNEAVLAARALGWVG